MTFALGLLVGGGLILLSGLRNRSITDVLQGRTSAIAPPAGQSQQLAPITAGGVADAIKGTLTPGRIDQGQDFSGEGKKIPSPWTGRVKSTRHPTGWPGTGGIIIQFDAPIMGARYGFIYEDVKPTVRTGQHVTGGQPVGVVTGGGHGIEIGFCDANGVPLAHNVYHEGDQTTWGKKMAAYLKTIGFA